ncbi:O-antigen ligase family protein [Thermocoleostomius sinensis]|uniref:O-antigen ligase family protein n=1 Tax=Thermocoleostomius sinensis A174 TaxID=2016057 RepID=A0A9E8ZDB1_9CYAN|nr:O-antigen ligase family protein [Thermocoleostomius sinensis]WAL59804.1 O-antigen ligase family protein [Thermocoleostomius sinensis A174]
MVHPAAMSDRPRSLQFDFYLLQGSLVILPYASYVGLAGLVGLIFSLLIKFKRTALDPVTRNGLLLLTGLLLLSCGFANNRAEAFLQLANFLPFFLLFAVVPFVLSTTERLAQLAWVLVISTVPINAIAFVEYLLRTSSLPRSIRRIPLIRWVRDRPHSGRAIVMFNHPNALASYLVLILGLGLGVLFYCARQPSQALRQPSSHFKFSLKPRAVLLLHLATYANLLGIFCSGSRNGLIVAILQLLVFAVLWARLVQSARSMWWISLAGIGSILVSTAWLGIGGRSLSLTAWANDARLRLWAVSLDLLRDRPWFGWGLGNYKFQFADRLLELYPTCEAVRTNPVVPVECADVTHPHNFWLMLATEAGLFVAIGFVAWVGYICVQAVISRLTKPSTALDAIFIGYLLAFAGCVAFACFDVTLYDGRVNALNWVILAGIYATGGDETERKKEG